MLYNLVERYLSQENITFTYVIAMPLFIFLSTYCLQNCCLLLKLTFVIVTEK